MEADAEPIQVLAHDREREVRAPATSQLGRQGEAPQAGAVCPPHHLLQQLLPLPRRDPSLLEVGARDLTPVVEEAGVVVLRFERPHLRLDEAVDLRDEVCDVGRQLVVHGSSIVGSVCSR